MSNNATVLVVTPTLGDSPFLDRTVLSVSSQPVPVRHVLSVPADRVDELQHRYRNTIVVPDAGKAGGIYGAINAALAAAPADWQWFTYINDDDTLLPGFGEVAASHMRRASPEPVTYGDVELIDERDQRISRITTESDPSWIPALLQQGISPLMQQGMLFHRDTVWKLCGFDTRYRLCADLDFWLRAYASGERFRYYPKSVAQFRLRDGQLSGNTLLTINEQDEIVERHLPARPAPILTAVARWRYRLNNLPRYIERFRTRGYRTSYQLLQPAK